MAGYVPPNNADDWALPNDPNPTQSGLSLWKVGLTTIAVNAVLIGGGLGVYYAFFAEDPENQSAPAAQATTSASASAPSSPSSTSTTSRSRTASPSSPTSSEPTPSRRGDSPTGAYSGVIDQTGVADDVPDTRVEIEIDFDSSRPTVTYPDLNCTGRLEYLSSGDGVYKYTESISTGTCDDGGTWALSINGNGGLNVAYVPPSGRYTISGQLAR